MALCFVSRVNEGARFIFVRILVVYTWFREREAKKKADGVQKPPRDGAVRFN